ncbi:GntR family transcriptional regulator [Corynebacterium marinum]|uniref:Transcription regulator n=1 Tax=Corynebacterium marinum DSM 44953 TaxID=1224162 RepID=A0A0B6TNQ2_9CORY|nr:GntR family transcriptional regulator [Corynebacterium marinum]AJK69558.1 transcription regulator [Corynebacterium marinum DSM 44953]GGO20459.1 putative transcriptional regulator, GntR family protein [Corynebacterium marinum]
MNFPLSRRPAYLAIADAVRERISRCGLTGGDRLPTERELVEEFGVARMTVRSALDVLQQEGLIERRRGRSGGTFVRTVPSVVELNCMEGLPQQLRRDGLEITARVLHAGQVDADPCVAAALQIAPCEPVYRVARLGSVKGTPLIIQHSFYPPALVPGLLEEDLSQSIPELLHTRWNLRLTRKTEVIAPGLAADDEAEALAVDRDLPLLHICRTLLTEGGLPVEYSRDVLRPDIAHVRVVTEAQYA